MVVFMRGEYGTRSLQRGYTIIEVSVIIIVIAILASIMIDSALGYQVRARDSERTSDIDVIARSLEQYYRTQAAVTGPSYPVSTVGITSLGSIVDNQDAILAPQQTENSLVIASTNSAQTPSANQYVYQPLLVNGSLCNTAPCPRYKLYYWREVTETVAIKDSLRQQ